MKTSENVLYIYEKLLSGEKLNKQGLANELEVSERVVQRYMADIRHHLDDQNDNRFLQYDKKNNCFMITQNQRFFSTKELLGLVEILIHTRAYPKEKLQSILEKLQSMIPVEERGMVRELIRDEFFHYTELRH